MDMLIKIMADYSLVALVLVAGYALLAKAPKKGKYERYAPVIMAGLTSYWLAKIIGSLWQPEKLRPFEILHVQPGASYLGNAGFPSDHMLLATFLTLAVWYVTRNPRYTAAVGALAVIIGLGRVLALVHSPLDIAGGIVIALMGGIWYANSFHKISKLKIAKTSNK